MLPYVDAHLDLAFNVTAHRRDLTEEVAAVRHRERRGHQEILVTLPELRRGNVGIVFATLFSVPREFVRPADAPPITPRHRQLTYETPEQARKLAVAQLDIYRIWEERGLIRLIRSRPDLAVHIRCWESGDRTLGAILLMEGADPILDPTDLEWW
jgi:membrane dipeptidase